MRAAVPTEAFSPYSAKRPPIGVVCQVALASIVLSAVVLAAQIPKMSDTAVPIVFAALAWVLFLGAASMLSRVGPFAWGVFRMVAVRQLLVELVIAGMLEFVFIYDHTPGKALAIFTTLVAVFCLDIALLIAFSVARYQDPA
ncbi:MAG: hypothetical protein M0Z47_06025 [Actinomycetota bacterium]|nr:hypothetical protein [Actinomycetota bacterium]